MTSRHPRAGGRWLAGLGVVLLLTGCDLGYYLHLARGQADIIRRCQPLEEVLARADLSDSTARGLALVREVRQYALLRIGLSASKNYTCFYDTGDRPVCWNVSACQPDRFEPYQWGFPVVGRVPYKGFFDLERARRERDGLRDLGYDALLRPVIAYSTLGYFSDPVLSDMLQLPEDALADLLIHELTHATIYVREHTDFNESLATFVGDTGSLDFLAERHGAESDAVERARGRRRDAALFAAYMNGVVASLDSLYSGGQSREAILAQRQLVFEAAKERYRNLRGELGEPGRYDGYLEWEVNNARLLSYRRYHRDLGLFEQLWESRGRDLGAMVAGAALCERAGDPWECVRQQVADAGGHPREPAAPLPAQP